MVDFAIAAVAQPQDVGLAFQMWANVRDDSSLRFVVPDEPMQPWSIALLGAMASDRYRRGLRTVASHSDGRSVANLPTAFGLVWPMASNALVEGGSLYVMPPIGDLKTARQLASEVGDALEKATPLVSPSLARMTRFVFEELAANAVQHAGAPGTGFGFVAVEVERRRLGLAFADAGSGFRASLQRYRMLEGPIDDDAEALQLALGPSTTSMSKPRTNRGTGLTRLIDLSDLMDGELLIASGTALLQRKTTAGQRTNVLTAIPPWQGSWISLQAPVG